MEALRLRDRAIPTRLVNGLSEFTSTDAGVRHWAMYRPATSRPAVMGERSPPCRYQPDN